MNGRNFWIIPNGDQIRRDRERVGITQAQLADAVGTTQQTIDKIEKGAIKETTFLPAIDMFLEKKGKEARQDEINGMMAAKTHDGNFADPKAIWHMKSGQQSSSIGTFLAGGTRWPSFTPGTVLGGGRFVATDSDGRLWQVDAESGTAKSVWIGEKPKKGKYEEIDAAAVINEICERRGISRAKLCEAINTKTSTLQRLMSGATKSLNLATYNKIIAWDNSQP